MAVPPTLINYYKHWPKSGPYVDRLNIVKYNVLNYLKNYPITNKSVVIFDLDDTVFYTDPLKIHNVELLSEKYNQLTYPGNDPIVDIVKYCNKMNIKVIFITARPYESEKSSIHNIKLLGMKYYKIFHNHDYPNFKFKVYLKQQLAKKYNIILSVGDNWFDLKGLTNCLCIKLPSPNDVNIYFTYDNEKYYLLE